MRLHTFEQRPDVKPKQHKSLENRKLLNLRAASPSYDMYLWGRFVPAGGRWRGGVQHVEYHRDQ